MWIKMFCMGMECWQQGTDQVTITHRNLWEVEVNYKKIGQSPDKEQAYQIAYDYMKSHQ